MKNKTPWMLVTLFLGFLAACGESTQGTAGGGYKPNDLTAPLEDPVIYLFNVSHQDGNLGGRVGADTLCETSLPTELNGMEVHAFLSVNANDEIVDMPINYNLPTDQVIKAYASETVIAESLADLLDGSLDASMEEAGLIGATGSFWSGSNANGTLAAVNCNEWSGTVGVFGAAGSATAVDSTWAYGISAGCTGQRDILCIAYED